MSQQRKSSKPSNDTENEHARSVRPKGVLFKTPVFPEAEMLPLFPDGNNANMLIDDSNNDSNAIEPPCSVLLSGDSYSTTHSHSKGGVYLEVMSSRETSISNSQDKSKGSNYSSSSHLQFHKNQMIQNEHRQGHSPYGCNASHTSTISEMKVPTTTNTITTTATTTTTATHNVTNINNTIATAAIPGNDVNVNNNNGPIEAIPLRTVGHLRKRYNTMSNLYAAHTIANPDSEQILFW